MSLLPVIYHRALGAIGDFRIHAITSGFSPKSRPPQVHLRRKYLPPGGKSLPPGVKYLPSGVQYLPLGVSSLGKYLPLVA